MSEPSITDWIGAIGTLIGVPATAWGIFKLFRKDKEQERQLKSLEKIAISQSETVEKMADQIQELSRHTSEFQFQSGLMNEANLIAQKHFDLLTNQFLESTSLGERQIELQKLERISKIRPHFTISNGLSNPERFEINLLNKGFTAKKIKLVQVDNEFAKFNSLDNEKEIENNQKLSISGYADLNKTYFNSNQVPFDIEIYFQDEDKNNYRQFLSRNNQTYKITNPEFLQPD